MTMTTETTKTQDEAQIRQIIADTSSGICATHTKTLKGENHEY